MLPWPDANIVVSADGEASEDDVQLFSDWLEGQILFGEERSVQLSKVVAVMKEKYASDDDAACWYFAQNGLRRLQSRHEILGGCSPIEFFDDRAKCKRDVSHTALRFCNMVALGMIFKDLLHSNDSYSEQGFLFECLAEQALQEMLPRWRVKRTGWAPKAPVSIDSVVKMLSQELGEKCGDHLHWTNRKTRDGGLDLFCYFPFDDMHSGYPAFLFQCATGKNWTTKTDTPNISLWRNCVQFACLPKKAFIIPFALTETEFRHQCNLIDGPLLDRYRLLSFGEPEEQWLTVDLKGRIDGWLAQRERVLMALDEQ